MAMQYLGVKQFGEAMKEFELDGLNAWESWASPKENKCLWSTRYLLFN